MKKDFLFFIFFNFISLILFTQNSIFPSFEDQPIWTISSSGFLGLEKQVIRSAEQVLTEGKNWVHVLTHEGGNIGWYRQDGPRIYFSFEANGFEYLMYDFSLEAGDSTYIGIPISFPEEKDSILYHVGKTDTVWVGGIPRKRLFVGYTYLPPEGTGSDLSAYSTIWIEGIGDIQHPFPVGTCMSSISGCEAWYNLDCLETKSGLIYSDGRAASCLYPVINPNRIYVDKDAKQIGFPRIHNGQSWETAFTDLQDAITMAEAGDTIWVAEGTYRPTTDANREISFELKQGVVLLGGFEGHECFEWERNPGLRKTILSGDIGIQGDSTDNSAHVVYTLGTDSTTLLDGFTIREGQAVFPGNSDIFENQGGGIYIDVDNEHPIAMPRIDNCIFEKNTAFNGGAIYAMSKDSLLALPKITNCIFRENRATIEGGALFKVGGVDSSYTFRLQNCLFEQNSSIQGGGAICIRDQSHHIGLNSCHFLNNNTISDGGAINIKTFFGYFRTQITNSTFENNQSQGDGGSIGFLYTGSSTSDLFQFELSTCLFKGNSSTRNRGGALLFNLIKNKVSAKLTDCIFQNNTSRLGGGGIDIFSFREASYSLHIQQSKFLNNQSGLGVVSGIYCHVFSENEPDRFVEADIKIFNSLFAYNQGALGIFNGSNGQATSTIRNCTFYKNGPVPIGKGWISTFDNVNTFNQMEISNSIIWEPDTPLGQIIYNNDLENLSLNDYKLHHNLISASNCNLPGGDNACGEGLLFNFDPQFINPVNNDFSLTACSPAINGGSNFGISNRGFDLAGNPRILDQIIDMGAFERPGFEVDIEQIKAVSCFDGADGQVDFTLLSGDGPPNINWSNEVETGLGSDNLKAGQYAFVIADSNNCQDTVQVEIVQAPELQFQYDIQSVSNSLVNDGSLQLSSIFGGTMPFSFLWSTGSTSPSLFNLAPGDYSLTITDGNDCKTDTTFTMDIINSAYSLNLEQSIRIFPTLLKSNEILFIELVQPIQEGGRIQLFSSEGKILRRELKPSFANRTTFRPTNLADGMYFLRIQLESGAFVVRKIIVASGK